MPAGSPAPSSAWGPRSCAEGQATVSPGASLCRFPASQDARGPCWWRGATAARPAHPRPAGSSHPPRGTVPQRPPLPRSPPQPQGHSQLLLPTCSSAPVPAWPALTVHEDNPRPLAWPPADSGPLNPPNGVLAPPAGPALAPPAAPPAPPGLPPARVLTPQDRLAGPLGPTLSPWHIHCSVFWGPYAKTAGSPALVGPRFAHRVLRSRPGARWGGQEKGWGATAPPCGHRAHNAQFEALRFFLNVLWILY